MNLLKIINFFKRKPKLSGKISIIELSKLLRNNFPNTKIILSDNNYDLCSLEEAKYFLGKDITNFEKYEKESYDCDDFSRVLWFYWKDWQETLAMGIAWSNVHAFNILIDDQKRIWIIEPQDDKIFPLENLENKYDPNLILI